MTLLVAGILLWIAGHMFKRATPGARARLGDGGKGLAAAVILLGVVLMVIGYRQAEVTPLFTPIAGMGHLNNALMVVAIFLTGVGGTKGTLYTRMRHPMLWGTVIWAVAHLLVNGDLASVLLFGGLGLWALAEMAVINASGPWVRPVAGRGAKGDLMNLVGTAVLYGLIAYVHIWLGHNPFVGTYG